MVFRYAFIFFFLGAAFVGCSSGPKNSDLSEQLVKSEVGQEELSEEENQEKVIEAFKVLDKRMTGLVAAAKKEGPKAIEFLASDLFLKANDASMRGDSHTSSYLYKHLLDLQPNDPYVKKKFSIELIRMGSLEEASILLIDVLAQTKYAEETLGLILGGVYTALNDGQKARETYNKVLKIHPGSEEACVFLAKSYSLEAKYDSAHKLLNKCNKRKGTKAIFSYYKGKVYIKQGKFKKAISSFKKALKADPRYHQAAMAMGLIQEEKDNTNGAIRIYQKFLKTDPVSYPVLSRLVQVMFAAEKFKEVLPYAETLSSLDPSDLNLRVRLGILYTDAKEFSQAIGVFKEILAAVPTSDKVLYYLGSLYQQTKDLEKALSSYAKIQEDSSLFVDSSLQIAQILQTLVQADDKRWSDQYRKYLSARGKVVEPLRVEFQMMLATYYEGKLNYDSAISAIEVVKDGKDYTESHDYYLASLYEKVNEYGKARGIVNKILVKNPNNAHALNFLGYSMLENNEDLEKAYALIKKAVKLKPNDGYIRDSLGWFYYKTGKIEKALVEIKKAFSLVNSDVVITKHLAIIYKDLKKYKKAKKFFVEALRNCKFESERKDVIKSIGSFPELRLPASEMP
jgi:tetratricopeptide (TPR) repeat protein